MVVNQSMPNISTIGPARESPTGSDNSIPGGPIGGAPGGGSPLADLEAIRTRGGTATAYPISTQPQPTIPPHILANPSAFYQMRMMEGTDFIPASLPPGTTLPSGPLPGAPPTVPGGAPGTVFIPRQFNHLDEGSPPVMPPGVLNMPPYGTAPLPAEGPPIHPRIRRPLNRTHSAPLPLGPHLMAGQLMPHPQQPQADQIRNQKMFIKQRIQNTVLQRAGSKNQMENVDEEAEVKLRESYEAFSSHPDVKPDLDAQVKGRAAFLQHQREMYHLNKHPLQHPGVVPTAGMLARPLARAQSSPAVTLPAGLNPSSPDINQSHLTTGIAYDPVMLKHECVCRNSTNHPENPERLESIWTRLLETGLAHRCMKIKCRKAALEELQLCHEEAYTLLYGTSSADRQKLAPNVYEACPPQFVSLPCGGVGVDSDTVWNEEYTSQATRTAVGSVIEMAQKVCKGHLRNGLCIVRPPGHHAEHNQPMGFCYFNAIAVAARVLQEQHEMKRILIIDWDVHHGNSTQQIFYSSPNVLYISLHRHDNGNFFPGTGSPDECGVEQGLGYNVNVSFAGSLNPPMSDAEYLSAFRNIVMPISRRFNPEIVLVSSGFDAADGHSAPLGGYKVSPTCFGHMTRQLMTLANGRVVLVLEGGYDLSSICDASEICVQALIDEEIPPIVEDELHRPPCGFAVEAMQNTIKHQLQYWPVLQQTEKYLGLSLFESESKSRKTLSRDESETVNAFASLSVVPEDSPDLPSSTEPMES